MSEAFLPEPTLSPAEELRVDRACQRFESAWKKGQRPRIEDFLDADTAPVRAVLLHELLALELTYRRQSQDQPRAEEFERRFPGINFQQVLRRVEGGSPTSAYDAAPGQRMAPDAALGAVPGLQIGEPISRGGMGAVYKAYQPALDRVVALKTVRPELLTNAGLELFKREAKLLAKFSHPHIVKILEFHPTAAAPYFLMEYVDGQPLDQALRPCTWEQRARLFQQVAAALAVAHGHGVVHGDLKPANILVDRAREPHILDFGLGHLARVEGDEAGNRGGTLGFLAPEILLGTSTSSFLSDIYALGVTLYVVLTGVMPFATRRHMEQGELRLPLDYNADVPEPLQCICLKAMELRPEDRYQTAEQLQQDLERFVARQPIFVRPTYYEKELTGRVRNHTAAIQMWEKAGLVSQRERDALVRPYRRVVTESPWLSETRHVLGGPLLIRLGTWLLLVSAVLWPAAYWDRVGTAARLASSGLPMLFMAVLGTIFLRAGQRRNAVACLGSFTLLLLVFVVVVLSEFRWCRLLQPPDWEVWGPRVTLAEPDNAAARGFTQELVLSNTQIFVAAALLTGWIALLVRLLRAVFFASWLALACVGLLSAILLLCGDFYRLHHEAVAVVSLHGLGQALALFTLGYLIERRGASAMAGPFYALGALMALAASVALARYGTEEWFAQWWAWDNEIWNLWILSYAVPLFAAAWALECFGSETQRRWSWLGYVLVPVVVHVPLHMLFETGPRTAVPLGAHPVYLYEALSLPASAAFLWLGKRLHLESFLYAGLGGLAVFLIRATFLHFADELAWPLVLALIGAGIVGVGVYLSRRREGRARGASQG